MARKTNNKTEYNTPISVDDLLKEVNVTNERGDFNSPVVIDDLLGGVKTNRFGSGGGDLPIKPSQDPARKTVNKKLREPVYKLASAGDNGKGNSVKIYAPPIEDMVFIYTIDTNRAKDFNVSEAQLKTFYKLVKELSTYKPGVNGRIEYLKELHADLCRYPTNVIPHRSANEYLMSIINVAVNNGVRVDIKMYPEPFYEKNKSGKKGYRLEGCYIADNQILVGFSVRKLA